MRQQLGLMNQNPNHHQWRKAEVTMSFFLCNRWQEGELTEKGKEQERYTKWQMTRQKNRSSADEDVSEWDTHTRVSGHRSRTDRNDQENRTNQSTSDRSINQLIELNYLLAFCPEGFLRQINQSTMKKINNSKNQKKHKLMMKKANVKLCLSECVFAVNIYDEQRQQRRLWRRTSPRGEDDEKARIEYVAEAAAAAAATSLVGRGRLATAVKLMVAAKRWSCRGGGSDGSGGASRGGGGWL